jgi:MFS family permease
MSVTGLRTREIVSGHASRAAAGAARRRRVEARYTARMSDRLFTTRFFLMCAFSFTVFVSAFQLFPVAPFHVLDLGGTTFASGLFLGFLTYSSALTAPITGAIGDVIGQRRTLLVCSLVIAAFSAIYAVVPGYRLLLALVVIHGAFWSGLLSNSGAYMTALLPAHRRAEGIGYWGLSTVAAIAVAPALGFWIYQAGWRRLCIVGVALNLVMAAIAWSLPETEHPHGGNTGALILRDIPRLLEWRVLLVSFTLFLYSFGYGGITSFSAMYADALGIAPKGVYLTSLAIVILVTRPFAGPLGDRIGHRRVFIPCLLLITAGLATLALARVRATFLVSAALFGVGFGTAYPMYVAYVMQHVPANRRGAAFGAILAAFDIGVGTGSTSIGLLIQDYGFPAAFGTAAALSSLALPYFLLIDRRERTMAAA